jgi:hypothetical protein
MGKCAPTQTRPVIQERRVVPGRFAWEVRHAPGNLLFNSAQMRSHRLFSHILPEVRYPSLSKDEVIKQAVRRRAVESESAPAAATSLAATDVDNPILDSPVPEPVARAPATGPVRAPRRQRAPKTAAAGAKPRRRAARTQQEAALPSSSAVIGLEPSQGAAYGHNSSDPPLHPFYPSLPPPPHPFLAYSASPNPSLLAPPGALPLHLAPHLAQWTHPALLLHSSSQFEHPRPPS